MKRLFPLLLCLLLCGCAGEAPSEAVPMSVTTAPTQEAWSPAQSESISGNTALQIFPLSARKVRNMVRTQQGLLLFSGYGSTTLTLLSGDDLAPRAEYSVPFQLEPEDPSLMHHDGFLSFFHTARGETLVLDRSFREAEAIPLPAGAVGRPILSSDRTTLFYCTDSAIFAWNRETGIHRTVTEMACTEQTLAGLYLKDSVLQCRTPEGGSLFLATDTGRLRNSWDGSIRLSAADNGRFYALAQDGFWELPLFGIAGGDAQLLLPEETQGTVTFLSEQHLAVCVSSSSQAVRLTCYDLEAGTRRASLSLNPFHTPKAMVCGQDKSLYILVYDPDTDCDLLYRWSIPQSPSDSEACFVFPYASTQEALDQCRAFASELESKYGIRIKIGQDALSVQPWDYRFQPEEQPRLLMEELKLLDQRLRRYPAVILEQTASHFTSLTVCLVRQIQGTGASGSLNTATGLQFLENMDAYVVIATGAYAEQALYHELFHAMETHIYSVSTALDQWDLLNPRSFSYGMTADSYLYGDGQAFADAYSMVSAKEDRARIFENAMLPDREDTFRTAIMQKKLRQLCTGIREAYGLTASESLPWEQYLHK